MRHKPSRSLPLLCVCLCLGVSPALWAQGKKKIFWPDLSTPAAPEGRGGKDVAVIVGVGSYAELPKIPGAAKNAEDWYLYLTESYGVPEARVSLLLDKKGTREKLFKAIREKAKQATRGGTFWLIFIGHGAPGSSKTGELLVGYDAQVELDSLEERGLGVKDLMAELKKGKQSRIVAVFDTSFSGHTASGEIVAGLSHDHAAKGSSFAGLAASHKKRYRQEVSFLIGTSGEQYAELLPGKDRPAFSYLVLGGLRGWADSDQSGSVSVQDLKDYAEGVLLFTARDQVQTPELATTKASLSLSSGSEAEPGLVALLLGTSARPGAAGGGLFSSPTDHFGGSQSASSDGASSDKSSGVGAKPSAQKGAARIEELILAKINEERAALGIDPLVSEEHLVKAARDHSEEMASMGYFSHTSPTPGRESFFDRIKLAGAKGFRAAGENIVFRQENASEEEMAEALFQQWMKSPPHRENMLDPSFGVTGLGLFQSKSRVWGTQVFADQVTK